MEMTAREHLYYREVELVGNIVHISTALLYILKCWRLGWNPVTFRADVKTSCSITGLCSDFYTRINKLDEQSFGKDRNRTGNVTGRKGGKWQNREQGGRIG